MCSMRMRSAITSISSTAWSRRTSSITSRTARRGPGWSATFPSSNAPTRTSSRSTISAGGRFASTSNRRRMGLSSPSFSTRSATPASTTRSVALWATTFAKGDGCATGGTSTSTHGSGTRAMRAVCSRMFISTATGPRGRCTSGTSSTWTRPLSWVCSTPSSATAGRGRTSGVWRTDCSGNTMCGTGWRNRSADHAATGTPDLR